AGAARGGVVIHRAAPEDGGAAVDDPAGRGLGTAFGRLVMVDPAAVQDQAAAGDLRWGRVARPAGDPATAGRGVVIDPAGVKDGRARLVQDAAGVLRGGVAGHRASGQGEGAGVVEYPAAWLGGVPTGDGQRAGGQAATRPVHLEDAELVAAGPG